MQIFKKYYDTIRVALAFFSVFLCALFCINLSAQNVETVVPPPPPKIPIKIPLIHGHRGARAIFPENTLKAFDYALEVGVDVLEMDLAVTSDNVLVVSHEPSINPLLCLDEKKQKLTKQTAIRALTLEEVQKYDCGSLKNSKFPNQKTAPDEKIPTLSQVFDLVKNSKHPAAKTVKFNIETKIFPYYALATPTPEEFAKLLYENLKTNGMVERTIVQSFDYRSLIAIKKLDRKILTSQLTGENLLDFVAVAKSSKADYISPEWQWITKDEVRRLRNNKIKVAPWTANTPEAWKYLIDIGVDEIITDDPLALKNYLANQNK